MGSATPNNALAATQLLSDRCAELGLPVWCLDAHSAILQHPEGFGPADLWMRSGLLGDLISSAVAAWRARDDALPIELVSGCWLVPVVTEPSPGESGKVTSAVPSAAWVPGRDCQVPPLSELSHRRTGESPRSAPAATQRTRITAPVA